MELQLRPAKWKLLGSAILFLFALASGCASKTYRFGNPSNPFPNATSSTNSPPQLLVTVGGEHPRLDRLEKVVHYPAKKFEQWFRKPAQPAPNHDELREQALAMSQEYLLLNNLYEVKIDVREYSPSEQWKRLKANKSIHPFWKYTTGTLHHVEYCLLPGRVLRRDSYNVFTNTLSINSIQPEQSLYAAGTAKYMLSKRYPGAFASACHLPIVPLYRDCYVANDVLSYARFREDWRTEKLLYPQIYGSFGSDLVSQATSLVPGFAYLPFYVKPVLTMGGRVGGSATGNVVLKQREKEMEELSEPTSATPESP